MSASPRVSHTGGDVDPSDIDPSDIDPTRQDSHPVAGGDRGSLWVTTCLNCKTRSPLFSKLLIQVDTRYCVEMAYPKDLTDSMSAAESAAGPVPPTK